MITKPSLDSQIYTVGFWAIIASITMAVLSGFFPLDAPGGYSASHADRIAWLSTNGGAFITAWVIQIVWMTAWTLTLFALAWKVADDRPLRALIAAMLVLVSFVAFIIPKFIAVWTIPVLASTVSAGAVGAEMADSLLLLLNVSIPFSLYTSFDYLGFWMYGIFSVLIARPLYLQAQQPVSMKIAAVSLGSFGVSFHGMMLGIFTNHISPQDLEVFVGVSFLLIFIAFIAAAFNFKSTKSTSESIA